MAEDSKFNQQPLLASEEWQHIFILYSLGYTDKYIAQSLDYDIDTVRNRTRAINKQSLKVKIECSWLIQEDNILLGGGCRGITMSEINLNLWYRTEQDLSSRWEVLMQSITQPFKDFSVEDSVAVDGRLRVEQGVGQSAYPSGVFPEWEDEDFDSFELS